VSPKVRVKTYTQTRLQALSFHAQRFLELAGIGRSRAAEISGAIEQRWLQAVGVYGADADGARVVEQEFTIDWGQHEVLNATNPVIDVSQPGWEDNLAVEVAAACARFVRTVEALSLRTSLWVIFTDDIARDPELHRKRCGELGLSFTGKVPDWKGQYTEVRVNVSGLEEASIRMRVYER
jgi:hypothetical protein